MPLLRALIVLSYLFPTFAFVATLDRTDSQTQQNSADNSTDGLRNKDVIDMLSGGLTAEIIIAKINSSHCDFDTSPEALKALKSAKVPDEVILAMVKVPKASAPPEAIVRTTRVDCQSLKELELYPAPWDPRPIKKLSCGSTIFVLQEKEPWFKVRTPEGTVGYVSYYYVAKTDSAPPEATATQSSGGYTDSSVPQNMIKAIAWRAVPWVTTSYYQTPGSANTECTGSGSWSGNIWQGSSSCSTQYTPAQTVPINWQHVTVYNLVETSDSRMVIACTRNWAFSKCSSLVPGNVFPFQYKNGKIEISGHKVGNGKEQELSFDIVSSEHR